MEHIKASNYNHDEYDHLKNLGSTTVRVNDGISLSDEASFRKSRVKVASPEDFETFLRKRAKFFLWECQVASREYPYY